MIEQEKQDVVSNILFKMHVALLNAGKIHFDSKTGMTIKHDFNMVKREINKAQEELSNVVLEQKGNDEYDEIYDEIAYLLKGGK